MVSSYGYITSAELEAYTGIDYSVVNAKYTAAVVDAQISIAERFVNTQLPGTTPTATDGVIATTLLLSERLMLNKMIADGHRAVELAPTTAFIDYLIEKLLQEDVYSPAGPVPMSGLDR